MATEATKASLFSSLSLGRAPRPPKPATETPTHPLLGSSSSSSNLAADHSDFGTSQPTTTRQSSWSSKPGSAEAANNLPYKPRQRHGGGIGSTGSANSFTGAPTSHTSSTSVAPLSSATASGMPAHAKTSTSTSTTFALPPSASDDLSLPDGHSSSSSSPTHGSSSATSRLQLQSLKAAAQRIGLGNGTMGMSMIDAIYEKSQISRAKTADADEWGQLLKMIMSGKAVILLPTTPASSLPVTPQTLRDHVAFISAATPSSTSMALLNATSGNSSLSGERDPAPTLVTLSGLIGTLSADNLVFESALPSSSPLLAALRSAITPALSSLRPTHMHTPVVKSPFPLYPLSAANTALPFPPLSKVTIATPVEAVEKDKAKAPVGKLSRINPFTLFASSSVSLSSSPKADATSTLASSSAADTDPTRNGDLLSPSLSSPDSSTPQNASLAVDHTLETASIRSEEIIEGFQITAYTVSKPIRYIEVHKALTKAMKAYIRDDLSRLPEKIVDRVIGLVLEGVCPSSGNGISPDLLKSHHGSVNDIAGSTHLNYAHPAETSNSFQNFVEGIYDELVAYYRAESSRSSAEGSGVLRRKANGTVSRSRSAALDAESDAAEKMERKEATRREGEELAEKKASDGTERVEAILSRLLYNRLFSPLESDDGRHDEALASRIAALNMLDLSLDHLGLVTRPNSVIDGNEGPIAEGLAHIFERVGLELQKLSLSSCLTPKDKTDVLINAHRIVVDGLAELPPIELRPEGEPYKPPSQLPSPASSPAPDVSLQQESIPHPATQSLHAPFPISTHLPTTIASNSTSLSTSPAGSDPLTSITEMSTEPPITSRGTHDTSVANSPSTDSVNQIGVEDALTDSMMTVTKTSTSPGVATATKPGKSSTSGADLILPIIIYAVVKSNPPQLASQLMFLRRYRSAICLTGEASYAIVNLTAVVEFLEHVQLAALGLGDESDKVISVEDLSPIGLNYLDDSNVDAASIASASTRLRGRVFQVGELAGSAAGSANKAITGVVDSSWTALRGLIGTQAVPIDPDRSDTSVPPPASHPGMRPRQASTFSLASVTASVASIAAAAAASTTAARTRSRGDSRASTIIPEEQWGANQEMMEVASRPESGQEQGDQDPLPDEEAAVSRDEAVNDEKTQERRLSDTRSIKSVSSMLSREGSNMRDEPRERVSLSNRLASIGVLGRASTGEVAGQVTPSEPSVIKPAGFLANLTTGRSGSIPRTQDRGRRGSLLSGAPTEPFNRKGDLDLSPYESETSRNPSPAPIPNEPPIERFMTCEAGDIRLSEVGELLRDYRRLGVIVTALERRRALHSGSDA